MPNVANSRVCLVASKERKAVDRALVPNTLGKLWRSERHTHTHTRTHTHTLSLSCSRFVVFCFLWSVLFLWRSGAWRSGRSFVFWCCLGGPRSGTALIVVGGRCTRGLFGVARGGSALLISFCLFEGGLRACAASAPRCLRSPPPPITSRECDRRQGIRAALVSLCDRQRRTRPASSSLPRGSEPAASHPRFTLP